MEHITAIGSRIRQAREQRGLTIRDIASTTKISTAALNAIEHNECARLPGGLFRGAYVRAFATEEGLPEDTAPTDERDSTDEVAFANAALGETGAQLRLEIRPHGPCWVSAVADRERVVYRLMQPGERTVVEARSLITLRVGRGRLRLFHQWNAGPTTREERRSGHGSRHQ